MGTRAFARVSFLLMLSNLEDLEVSDEIVFPLYLGDSGVLTQPKTRKPGSGFDSGPGLRFL